ncbi:MAG: type I-E CRISPR-associated protein Cas6/Cse3/CasE [Candidatus Omnitrophica bacterium]|nr:type I-E CRISPR-associated protein Cas6/Cse3/CasE [Candidatus Omnitrophota bacterium]
MIASILKLNRNDCKALKLEDVYSVHRIVYSLFPKITSKSQRDFIFADKGGNVQSRQILILSKRPPLSPEYGEIESKEVPKKFLNYDQYGFEVTLNPVTRNGTSKSATPVRGVENIRNWFLSRSASYGFNADPESLQVCRVGVISFDKQKNGAKYEHTHNTATFIGKLQVVDRDLFVKSFNDGIGRAKGFGFGLLQLVPLKNN